jgi:glycosyltransferase involved in cell wall biosynthesis
VGDRKGRRPGGLKINFVLPCYPKAPIGGFRVVYEYANRLVSRGHSVSVTHPKRMRNLPLQGGFIPRMKRRFVDALRSWFPPKIDWHRIDERVELLYVPEPTPENVPDADVVFATAWHTAEYVWEYPPEKGRKFYLIQHFETWAGPEDRVVRTWLLPMHKVVIARWLLEKGRSLGVDDEHMVHIPNGIDHCKYRLIQDIENRPRRIAMMYSDVEWKGSKDGITALETLKASHPDLEAILFGVGRRPKDLPRWIEYVQNPDQEYLVREIYNRSSIYLCPSWTEGWHLPPAEAMACGCALVSTDIGGVRDYAIDGVTALLAPVRSPGELARRADELLQDDGRRITIAREGKSLISKFDWEKSSSLLEEYIKRVSDPAAGSRGLETVLP